MEAANLVEAIADLDRQERTLTLELMDVTTDIETPDASDAETEDEETEESELPEIRSALMLVESLPRRNTEYSELYDSVKYRSKAELKVKFAKKLVRSVNLGSMMTDPNFAMSLQRVELTYPDDGGRAQINTLVAIHNVIREN